MIVQGNPVNIIEYMKSFNRKERFHLIGQFMGNQDFRLSNETLNNISELIGVKISTEYFSAMDYHLDWVYASLAISLKSGNIPRARDLDCVTGTQQDVDFILAFEDGNSITHIVMIEAKGKTSFENAQMISKGKRLKAIFGEGGDVWENVKPHFLICSPKKPKNLKLETLPKFMINKKSGGLIWFQLNMPSFQQKVTRCNETGKSEQNGSHWKTEIA